VTERVTVFLGLGSNLGDRRRNLKEALRLIEEMDGVTIRDISPLYETAPVGGVEQGDFFNIVVKVETNLAPRELLHAVQGIEARLQRVRDVRWGPRTIDIDILLYGDIDIDEADLVIPHPEIMNRAFVLAPLNDIAPYRVLSNGRTVREQLAGIEDQAIKKIGSL